MDSLRPFTEEPRTYPNGKHVMYLATHAILWMFGIG